jgi:ribosomal protein L11 methyltransferase
MATSWFEAIFYLDAAQAERLGDELMDVGALSSNIEDAWAGTDKEEVLFGEPGEPVAGLWQESRLTVLFEADMPIHQLIQTACTDLNMPLPQYELQALAAQDWVRLTQSQFDPIQIAERLWITPSWHEAPKADVINLVLDPGLAFGTGSHPTTRLCLQWLHDHLSPGVHVLDYGCGSGILAIAAKKLGAAKVDGVDVDDQAILSSRQNADQNETEAHFYLPDALPEGEYDVLVANILSNPLRLLAQMLAARVKTGGTIVLSGILAEQASELSAIYAQWFDMQTPSIDEGWVRLTGIKC